MADLQANNPITADGDYDFKATGSLMDITADGTWGGGTLTIKRKNPSGSNYIALTGGAYTADFTAITRQAPQAEMRLTLAGATTPSLTVGTGRAFE